MFPILFQIGDFQVATYGLFVAAGYLAGILWLSRSYQRMGLTEPQFWGLVYALFFGAIFGGKLLYWMLGWREILSGELRLVRDFRFGFVFYGGLVGTLVAGRIMSRRYRFDFLKVTDYFLTALPMGHAIGRLGCFSVGCCAGRPTQLPWGVRFTDPASLVPSYLLGVPLHPSQLYSVFANIAVFAAAYAILKRVQKGRLPAGSAAGAYIALYSFARFFIEFSRGDDRGGFVLGMSVSQWVALAGIAAAALMLKRLGAFGAARTRRT